ncbi:MRC1-like domain-containing protein [Spinellus fusiger]|nr:MRC1-like domain-containing protein [Spinellus fusiger]
MDISDDEQLFPNSPTPVTTTGASPAPATVPKQKLYNLSDSEDEDNLDDNNTLIHLNISNKLKNMLRFKNIGHEVDDDDDDTALFTTPSILKTPGLLGPSPTKKVTFVELPEYSSSTTAFNPPTHTTEAPKTVKKKEKKKARPPKTSGNAQFKAILAKVLENNASSSESDSESERIKASLQRKKPEAKKKKKSSNVATEQTSVAKAAKKRLARKLQAHTGGSQQTDDMEQEDALNDILGQLKTTGVPELLSGNNETAQPKSSFLFLESNEESATENTSSQRKRGLSKKDLLEMRKEAERLQRSMQVILQPRSKKKTLAEFLEKFENTKGVIEQPIEKRVTEPVLVNNEAEKKKAPAYEDSDSDIEIIGKPGLTHQKPPFPQHPNVMAMAWSSMRTSNSPHRDLNMRLQDCIAKEMLERRKRMEEEARARGSFATAEERAKESLMREKEAAYMHLQIKHHFTKDRNNSDKEDVPEEELEELEYSGEDEDDDADNVDDDDNADDTTEMENKKDKESGASSDDEQLQMQSLKNKRRRNRKSNPLDDAELTRHIIPKKAEPKNSIINFFKNQVKTNDPSIVESTNDSGEAHDEPKKLLSRLIKRPLELDLSDVEMEEILSDIENPVEEVEEIQALDESNRKKPMPQKQTMERSEYVEEEAQESEDEFFGLGGPEMDENEENLDEYEQDDLLVEANEETDQIDEGTLRAAYNKDMAELDKNMTQRLMSDITGGGMRRRQAAKEAGLMLDDYDFYDDDDMDLVAIRRAASAKRRKLREEEGNLLDTLAKDPKTAAFAKAAQPLPDEDEVFLLSDGEEEKEELAVKKRNTAIEDDDDDDDEQETEQYSNNIISSVKQVNVLESASDDIPAIVRKSAPGVKRKKNVDIDDWTDCFAKFVQIETKRVDTNALETLLVTKPLLRTPGRLERFTSLLSEANGVIGGSSDTGARQGFGSVNQRQKEQQNKKIGFVQEISEPTLQKSGKRLLGVLARTGSFT